MLWGAIVVAAGRGTRFGGPKQLAELAGAPLLSWPVRTLAGMPEIVEIVIVTQEQWLEPVRAIAAAVIERKPWAVVEGGETRQASVRAGLAALPARCQAIAIHDGARPLLRADDVRNAMRAVRAGHAVCLGTPVTDTIKVVDSRTRIVQRTLDRAALWAVQTPQLAMAHDIRRAHAQAARSADDATDDAELLERAGVEIEIVPGSAENIKVTVREDFARAEQLMGERLQGSVGESEVLLVEIFAHENLVDAVCAEIVARGGTIDGVERELPLGAAVRAFIEARSFEGFGERFEAVADGSMTFTTKFSHYRPRERA